MSRIIYTDDKFKILRNRSGFILINENGDYSNHGHFKKESTCKLLIDLINKNIIPHSDYLRQAVLRICINDKYKDKVKRKIKKDKDKQMYININKGRK